MPKTHITARDGYLTKPAWQVPVGVTVNIAGWITTVTVSEPWSDWVWYLKLQGKYQDGDPFETFIHLPVDAQINYKEEDLS